MMPQKTQLKQTALLVALVYFALSFAVAVRAADHGQTHSHHANHAAQHASLICVWMCAASSFVHSADPYLTRSVEPSPENPPDRNPGGMSQITITSFHIRPPPSA